MMILGGTCLHRIVHLTKSALSKIARPCTSSRLAPKRTLYNSTKVLNSSTNSSSTFHSTFVGLKTGGTVLDSAKKVQRLMRQIYSRVHPDLFTNHLQAREQNEDSLKILRNLVDLYVIKMSKAGQFESQHVATNSGQGKQSLTFYTKQSNEVGECQLRKFRINLNMGMVSVQDEVESIFDQFIDYLNFPVAKFGSKRPENKSGLPSFIRNHTNYSYRVTYKQKFDHHTYDEVINEEEYKNWCEFNQRANQLPSLDKWLLNNKQAIKSKLEETMQLNKQLEANKNILIKKWRLHDIKFKTNWSLKNFNSYMLGLLNYKVKREFEGLTLVLTNSMMHGLQKNGQIYLNCDQVFEEWLNILKTSRKEFKLLKGIAEMEVELSRLLKKIRIGDNLDQIYMANIDNDRSIITSAAYYSNMLEHILKNLTADSNADVLNEPSFSHLQMTLQNVHNLEINNVGQVVIGAIDRITYNETVKFIKQNEAKAIRLYEAYVKSLETEHTKKELVKKLLNVKSVSFERNLNNVQRIESLDRLIKYTRNVEALDTLRQVDLMIGNSYGINENGSIRIPHSWYAAEKSSYQ